MLRAQLRACTTESDFRKSLRKAGPRSREEVPVIDIIHEPASQALATLIGLLERNRFDASILLIERGLDESGTPFVHHESSTAALGAASTSLFNSAADTDTALAAERQNLLHDLVSIWMIAAVIARGGDEGSVQGDLARGMGPWLVPQGWGGKLIRASTTPESQQDSLIVTLIRAAVRERAPGMRLRVVRHALEALDAGTPDQHVDFWRRALAFVVGADIFQDPLGRLHAEYNAHRDSPASRHRRAVEFIYNEAIPTYQSVRD